MTWQMRSTPRLWLLPLAEELNLQLDMILGIAIILVYFFLLESQFPS